MIPRAMSPSRFALVSVLVFAVSATSSLAESVTIESERDNTLYEEPTGALSNGMGASFFAGRTLQVTNSLRRGLVYFDIESAVPAGSTITDVQLQLRMARTQAGDTDIFLHRVLTDWGEGTSNDGGNEGDGTPSTQNDATWIHTFFPNSLWATPGGDFDPVPRAVQTVGGVGFYTWTSPEISADVQSWLDNPGSNFGWLVIGDETAPPPTAKKFQSHESSIARWRPQLKINYCPPGAVAAWSNYGQGWPGTNGVPAFTSNADPALCTPITLSVDNSLGSATMGFLFIGFASAQIPTPFGGDILVSPFQAFVVDIPVSGAQLTGTIPCDGEFCGISLFLQVIELDPGASDGYSFTPGLELAIGP